MYNPNGLSKKLLDRQTAQWEAFRASETRRIAAEDAVVEAYLKTQKTSDKEK